MSAELDQHREWVDGLARWLIDARRNLSAGKLLIRVPMAPPSVLRGDACSLCWVDRPDLHVQARNGRWYCAACILEVQEAREAGK